MPIDTTVQIVGVGFIKLTIGPVFHRKPYGCIETAPLINGRRRQNNVTRVKSNHTRTEATRRLTIPIAISSFRMCHPSRGLYARIAEVEAEFEVNTKAAGWIGRTRRPAQFLKMDLLKPRLHTFMAGTGASVLLGE
jgi:hypothetical protein